MFRPSARSPARIRNRSGGCLERGRLFCLSGGAGEVEGGRVVVGEHVGEVLDPVGDLRFDPGRGRDVAGGAGGSRELGVGDVADESVAEGVLGLAVHRGAARGPDELRAGELARASR